MVMSSSLRNHLPSKLFALRSIISADATSGWRIGTDERTTPRSEFDGIAKDCDVVVYGGERNPRPEPRRLAVKYCSSLSRGRDDLKLMGVGILDFSNDQAAQLCATLKRRAGQQEVAQTVELSASR